MIFNPRKMFFWRFCAPGDILVNRSEFSAGFNKNVQSEKNRDTGAGLFSV